MSMHRLCAAMIAFAFVLISPPRAVAATRGPLQAIAQQIRSDNHLPALILALAHEDGRVEVTTDGSRRDGTNDPVHATDRFHIGSAIKPMTAVVIARLVDAGTLHWNMPLAKLLPGDVATMRPEYRGVTLRELLSHSAGLPAYTDVSDADWARWRKLPGTPTQQRGEFVREVLTQAPIDKPGKAVHYSNAGYVLAGYIAEHASGLQWKDLLQREVLNPLHMTGCRPGWPVQNAKESGVLGHRATDHGFQQVSIDRQPAIGAFLAPAGDLSCRAVDLARFAVFALRARAGHSELLSAANSKMLFAPALGGDTGMALGWGVAQTGKGDRVYSILGSLELYSVLMVLEPAHHRAMIAMTNVGESAQVKKALIEAVQDIRKLH